MDGARISIHESVIRVASRNHTLDNSTRYDLVEPCVPLTPTGSATVHRKWDFYGDHKNDGHVSVISRLRSEFLCRKDELLGTA
ncbi:hypothetical protein GWI33_009686 [Rhynchophorus ferrugineus]|uniref:Uncharacterized protein n=1 Tax=Rhynchophorus ferrugineus TaxID=354439 RepID=A0A834MEI7_RHYFE|nr:hypothetical protein GWI33_009686 [Rhynchophorus ferrugineus]